MKTRRNWAARPLNRHHHRLGCAIAQRLPRRQVIDRLLAADGSILADLLECGHVRVVSTDRRHDFTRTRRCWPCAHPEYSEASP